VKKFVFHRARLFHGRLLPVQRSQPALNPSRLLGAQDRGVKMHTFQHDFHVAPGKRCRVAFRGHAIGPAHPFGSPHYGAQGDRHRVKSNRSHGSSGQDRDLRHLPIMSHLNQCAQDYTPMAAKAVNCKLVAMGVLLNVKRNTAFNDKVQASGVILRQAGKV